MGTPKNREMPQGKRKKAIISRSKELFANYGYYGVTMQIIAEKSGISAPGLYNHFKGKPDIYDAVLSETKAALAQDKENYSDHKILVRAYLDGGEALKRVKLAFENESGDMIRRAMEIMAPER